MPTDKQLIQTCKETLKQLRELHSSFQCFICHAPIQNTHVISGCQHRFCGKCIEDSARRCNSECPECRMIIPLFSHLRRDTKYDELVQGVISVTKLLEERISTSKSATTLSRPNLVDLDEHLGCNVKSQIIPAQEPSSPKNNRAQKKGRGAHAHFDMNAVEIRFIEPEVEPARLVSIAVTEAVTRSALPKDLKRIRYYGGHYVGEMQNGKRNGKGQFLYENGNIYDGEWRDDLKHGKGTYKWTGRGDAYEGQWKDNRRHGRGELTLADGSIYNGEWKRNEKHGKGKFTWPDGNFHEGQYKNGKKNGYGIFKFAGGNIRAGVYRDDELCSTLYMEEI